MIRIKSCHSDGSVMLASGTLACTHGSTSRAAARTSSVGRPARSLENVPKPERCASFGSKSPPFVDSLAAGADGNLWFTAGLGKSFVFGRMSPSGAVTQFPMRGLFTGSVDNGSSASLVVSALGNNLSQNEVLKVSMAGAIAQQDPCGDFRLIQDLSGSGGRIALVLGRDFDVLQDRPDHGKRRGHVL